MSAVIGALRVSLSIDTAAWETGLKNAQAGLAQAGQRMKSIGQQMSLYISAPIAAGAAAATMALRGLADEAREISKASMLSNTSVEEFQRQAHFTKALGIETEKLGDIYKDVGDKIGDYFQTGAGPMVDFFEQVAPKIGMTQEAFANLSGPEGLQLYYNSLKDAGLAHSEILFYMEAIASDAALLIPHLENVRTGVTDVSTAMGIMSQADVNALQRWNEASTQLSNALRQVALAVVQSGLVEWFANIASAVAQAVQSFTQANPVLASLAIGLAAVLAVAGPLIFAMGALAIAVNAIAAPVWAALAAVAAIAGGLTVAYAAFSAARPYIDQFITDMTGIADPIAKGFDLVIDATKTMVNTAIGLVVGMVNAQIESFSRLPGAMADIAYQAANLVVAAFGAMANDAIGVVNGMISAINGIAGAVGLEGMEVVAEVDWSISNPHEGKASARMNAIAGSFSDALGTDYVGGLGETISSMSSAASASLEGLTNTARNTAAAIGPGLNNAAAQGLGGGAGGGGAGGKGGGVSEAARKAAAEMSKLKDEGQRVWEATRTPLEAYNLELERLSNLLKQGAIDQETFNRASQAAKENLDKTTESTSILGQMGETVGQSLAGMFSGLIDGSKSFGESLKGLVKQLGDMALNNVFKMLFGGFGKGGGKGIGGILSSLFGGLPGFARGGSFKVGSSNGMAGVDSQLVAFRASPNETVSITRPDQERSIGGAAQVSVNIINNANAEVSSNTNPDGSIDIMIDKMMSRKMSERGSASNNTLRNNFGARGPLIRR